MRSSAGSNAAATRARRATRRERSTSICYYTARAGCDSPRLTVPHPRHARARVRAAAADRRRTCGHEYPGRGLARRTSPHVRGQRIRRTRTRGPDPDHPYSTDDRNGPRRLPLHRRRRPDRRRQDEPRARARAPAACRRAARAARRQSVPRALLRRHGALRAADAAHVPVPARRPVARAWRSSTCSAGRRSPTSCSTRIRCSRASTCPTTSTRCTTRSSRT